MTMKSFCKMKKTPSVCLHPFFSSMFCPVNLKLYMCVENRHMQRLTKFFVQQCLFYIKKNFRINLDLLLLLPMESMSKNTDSATLPLQLTLWLKLGLHCTVHCYRSPLLCGAPCRWVVQPCRDREEERTAPLGSSWCSQLCFIKIQEGGWAGWELKWATERQCRKA